MANGSRSPDTSLAMAVTTLLEDTATDGTAWADATLAGRADADDGGVEPSDMYGGAVWVAEDLLTAADDDQDYGRSEFHGGSLVDADDLLIE